MKSVDSRIDFILGLPEKKKTNSSQHIKFFFQAGEAKSGGTLSAVVSMFQLNIAQVCKELNTLSLLNYPIGLVLPVKIFKPSTVGRTTNFKIILGAPTLKYCVQLAILSTMNFKSLGIISSEDDEQPALNKKISEEDGNNEESEPSSLLSDEEIGSLIPKKIPISLLYDVVCIHHTISKNSSKLVSFSRSFFGTLSTMNLLTRIDLENL